MIAEDAILSIRTANVAGGFFIGKIYYVVERTDCKYKKKPAPKRKRLQNAGSAMC